MYIPCYIIETHVDSDVFMGVKTCRYLHFCWTMTQVCWRYECSCCDTELYRYITQPYLRVFNNVLRIDLILLKDDKNSRVACIVHTAVIKPCLLCLLWRSEKTAGSFGEFSNKNKCNKHHLSAAFGFSISIWVLGISGKVTSYKEE